MTTLPSGATPRLMVLSSRTVAAAGVIALGWALFGVALAQQVYVLQAGRGPAGAWSHAMALQLDYCMLWALVTPAVLRLGRAFPVATPRARRAPGFWWKAAIHLPASLSISMMVQIAHSALLSRLFPGWFPRPSLPDVARSLMSNVDYGFILYWIVLLLGQTFDYARSLDNAQVRQAELQEQLAEAQLQALQMQMRPHFLFNALNSIAELIHEDPQAAERTVTSLGELLRLYMQSCDTHETSLEKEIAFLRRYLDVQSVRFEERLAVRIDLAPGTENAVVPSLILQPLVENAILHGIADRERDGAVHVEATAHGSSLMVDVIDNGHGVSAREDAPFAEGRGLRNTRRRLERLYGAGYELRISRLDGGGTRASVRIPLRRSAPCEG